MKIKDLEKGMDDVNIEAEIDYITPIQKKSHGEAWGIVYIKDDTKDIKLVMFGDKLEQAEEGRKIKITKGYVTSYRGQLQLNTRKDHSVEYID